jgi:hypothetical protein
MSVSLHDWLKNGWLVEHETSRQEIVDLLGVVDRDLADSQATGLSPDWRLNIAYNAAMQAATAALAAVGYRAARDSHHHRVIQSLAETISADPDLIGELDLFRKKWNIGGYERAGMVSDHEAARMQALARRLRDEVRSWLCAQHPGLT